MSPATPKRPASLHEYPIGVDVFSAAIDRMVELYEAGHRIVVSVSGGKDSTCAMEICALAAKIAGRLPIDVVTRDEEIMFPGTYEYLERIATQREDVRFHWLIANQPIVNVFNRKEPYFWTFDPLLPPEKWVRLPPSYAVHIPEKNIADMVNPGRFPPPEGKKLMVVMGLRTAESMRRRYGLMRSGGYVTKPQKWGIPYVRPIYDWQDADVWRAIQVNHWDHNEAYTVMYRLGIPARRLRIAPPTLTVQGSTENLQMAAHGWPKWFDKVCERLPGVRSATLFGRRAVEPEPRQGETWEACFRRVCIEDAPAWIASRATKCMEDLQTAHAAHNSSPLQETFSCGKCAASILTEASWRGMARYLFFGDPFSMKAKRLPYVEPEFFRPGAGTWGGKPYF